MCHFACLEFGQRFISADVISGKKILEVGARQMNGSLRELIEALEPAAYLGVDIEPGPGVDRICNVDSLLTEFGAGSFDFVLCTEVLEHVENWRSAISNMQGILAENGRILLTTRSLGFPYHSAPYDFWRYEIEDMHRIFQGFTLHAVLDDPQEAGVFVFAEKPAGWRQADFSEIRLYSMLHSERVKELSPSRLNDKEFEKLHRRSLARHAVGRRLPRRVKAIVKKTERAILRFLHG